MYSDKGFTKTDVKAELWRRGKLEFLLTPVQKDLYKLYYGSPVKTQVWLCGRRTGKSFCIAVLALEECLRHENVVVKIVTDTKVHLEQIILPIFRKILLQCPASLKPTYSIKNCTFRFRNGSEIHLAGSDGGHAEKLRGAEAKAAFVDEAGSCDDLNNLVKDILLPSTLLSKGKVVLASTPPKDPRHEFIRFIETAERRGTLVKKTTYENPLIPPGELEDLIVELGGRSSDAYKREIECRIVRDSTLSIVPEFDEDLAREVVKAWKKPPYFDTYESMDLGMRDGTVILFAYHDFKAGKVVIEDELVYDFQKTENSIPKLVSLMREKERALWLNPLTDEVKPVKLRVSDINPIVTSEIAKASNFTINFHTPPKDDKEAAVNQLRLMIASKKVIIHPRCTTLISQLRYGLWQPNRKFFARDQDGNHADAIDSLVYLIRSINYSHNPYPPGYGYNPEDLVSLKQPQSFGHHHGYEVGTKVDHKTLSIIQGMFGPRRPSR